MNSHEPDLLEAELRRLAPAPLPDALKQRLTDLRPTIAPQSATEPVAKTASASQPQRTLVLRQPPLWQFLLRWLVPATAAIVVLLAVLVWRPSPPAVPRPAASAPTLAQKSPNPKDVEIDRQLVASFDAVARLPGGEPVRFRCRQWADDVVVRDPTRGIVIERRTPRLEVVPVSYETY